MPMLVPLTEDEDEAVPPNGEPSPPAAAPPPGVPSAPPGPPDPSGPRARMGQLGLSMVMSVLTLGFELW